MREEGYYKVKYKGKWEVAKYIVSDSFHYWNIADYPEWMSEKDFDQLGEKIEFDNQLNQNK